MLEKTNIGIVQIDEEEYKNNKPDTVSIPNARNIAKSNSRFSDILSEIIDKTISVCGITERKCIYVEILDIDGNYIHGIITKGREEIYISVASIIFLIRNTPESRRRYFSRFGGCDFAMKITSNSFLHYS